MLPFPKKDADTIGGKTQNKRRLTNIGAFLYCKKLAISKSP
jgi:hypothetical protein